ncbi:MAG: YlbF family regulator [Christensenellales bacterium]|jgi:cell fate (sporulation/competence/biofilm development) regulator YlbF (YheA/YmcA/DUF963 family)
MYVYDKANELADALKNAPEYKKYSELKEKIYSNDSDKALVKKYKKMQFEAQAEYMAGKTPSEEALDEIRKLGEVLQFNKDISEFLSAEYMLNRIIGDVYRIIGQAVELDVSFMEQE